MKKYTDESNKMRALMTNNYFVKLLDDSISYDNKLFYFIVMEYIGSNLEKEFNNNRIVRDNDIRKIMLQLLNGIKFMKEKEIIHRDLKLNNILLDIKDFNTYNYTIKIADFGCSTEGTLFSTNEVGTRLYQAPELLFDNKKKEKKNEKVDVWSLGIIAYLFEQKKYPFKDANEIMTKSLDDYTKKKTNFLGQIIFESLNKDNESRIDWDYFFESDYFKQFNEKNLKKI